MFLCSLIEELRTKEENDKTGCNFNFGHECIMNFVPRNFLLFYIFYFSANKHSCYNKFDKLIRVQRRSKNIYGKECSDSQKIISTVMRTVKRFKVFEIALVFDGFWLYSANCPGF